MAAEPDRGGGRPWWLALLVLLVLASAAWGVPELLRRRQATLALDTLGRIAQRAHVYYVKPRMTEGAGRMPCQFPRGAIRSTPAKSCCDPRVNIPGTALCDPDKVDWNRVLWKALQIEVDEPQPFVYAWEATGTLADARYTITAWGDLDCDGELSTFRFEGRGDPRATEDNCLLGTRPAFTQVGVGE